MAKASSYQEAYPPPPARAGSSTSEEIQRVLKRQSFLRMERSTWIPTWMEMAQYLLPFHWRYLQAERNKGWKRHSHIVNSSPLLSVRTAAAGIVSGLTSKARRWAKLSTGDPQLDEFGPVRQWCSEVEDLIFSVFARSNIYRALANMYAEMIVFGTAAAEINEDPHSIIRAYVLPLGQYSLTNSARLTVDGCYREYSMTARQLVQEFGADNCSEFVHNAIRNNNKDAWVQVLRATEPSADYQSGADGPRGMPWKSCYLELGGHAGDAGAAQTQPSGVPTHFLREAGFREFPIVAARWNTLGEDVYGFSPGWEVLGDAKQLQDMERRKLQLLAKIVNPPMLAPSALRTKRISMQPGDIVYADSMGSGAVVRPAQEMPPAALREIREDIRLVEQRIARGLFEDLWQAFQQWEDGQPITATEVNARKEEKMLLLGPAIESIEGDLLDPLFHRTLSILARRGMMPPAPRELMGRAIVPEYTSIMAQAAKMLGIGNLERFGGYVAQTAQVKATVIDVIDWDKTVRDYADRIGIKPELLKDEEQVQAERDAARQAAQAQQQQAAVAQAARSAKDLSGATLDPNNALGALIEHGLGPEAAAQAGVGGNLVQ